MRPRPRAVVGALHVNRSTPDLTLRIQTLFCVRERRPRTMRQTARWGGRGRTWVPLSPGSGDGPAEPPHDHEQDRGRKGCVGDQYDGHIWFLYFGLRWMSRARNRPRQRLHAVPSVASGGVDIPVASRVSDSVAHGYSDRMRPMAWSMTSVALGVSFRARASRMAPSSATRSSSA